MTKAKVIVYSTSACPWCKTAKQFLKDNKIAFKDIDVGADQKEAEEMIKRSGQMGVPVIDVDGKLVIGFDAEKLKGLLKIK